MKKLQAQTGIKKLSRQYAVMVFAVQMITALILCFLIRKEAVNIYLSAKNDIISEWLGKETKVMELDDFNPSPSWNLDYWIAHYTKFSIDGDDDDNDRLYDYSYELNETSENEQEAAKVLNALSPDEQLEYARFQFFGFLNVFGRHSDNYGYEGCSCFAELEDGRYMVIAEQDKECNMLNDSIYIEESSMIKDKIMAALKDKATADKDLVDFIRVNKTDEKGKTHNIYIGFAPIIGEGEIKAVMTLEFSYDSFVDKINGIINVVFVVLISVNLLVCFLFINRTRKIAARPIASIQSAVRDYMTTRSGESARNKLKNIRSDNEIGVLAEDVDKMIVTIDDYVGRIEEAGVRHKALTKDVMEALASAIDAKDRYTNGHSKRVAEYSRKLAKLAGKQPEECEMVYDAGLLHDVGKIGVPLEILQKKSRLTDEEFEQIKRHPVVGGQILSAIHETPWLSIGAKYHHERYNGRGYPEGLKGGDNPEIARIIAAADAYDAMTSNRSYRNAIPTMSYPTARLVWHCPYFCVYSSSDGQIKGENYREYLLLKLDGETGDPTENAESRISAEQKDSFKGWNAWIEQNRRGFDCTVNIRRQGNTITLQTENAGVAITGSTTITDGSGKVYLAITGDQCAVTDIRIRSQN